MRWLKALGDQSLFGEKNLIEVVFPRATIGKNGPAAVEAIIEHAGVPSPIKTKAEEDYRFRRALIFAQEDYSSSCIPFRTASSEMWVIRLTI